MRPTPNKKKAVMKTHKSFANNFQSHNKMKIVKKLRRNFPTFKNNNSESNCN